jgi:hypothetical protein
MIHTIPAEDLEMVSLCEIGSTISEHKELCGMRKRTIKEYEMVLFIGG